MELERVTEETPQVRCHRVRVVRGAIYSRLIRLVKRLFFISSNQVHPALAPHLSSPRHHQNPQTPYNHCR
jgi:hypothetical protein